MELAFIVVYAVILGSVVPYVGLNSEHYGTLVPAAIALTVGSLLWAVLTLVGMSHEDAWIWTIVMLAMPVAMWFGSKQLERIRAKQQ